MPDTACVLLFWIQSLIHRNAARLGHLGKRLARFLKHRYLIRERHQAAKRHIAVRRAEFDSVSHAAEHVRRGDAAGTSGEGVKNDVARIGKCLHEELDQRSRKWCRVRTLAGFRFHFDYVARPRDTGEAPVVALGTRTPRRGAARAGSQQATPGCGPRIVRRVVEAVL